MAVCCTVRPVATDLIFRDFKIQHHCCNKNNSPPKLQRCLDLGENLGTDAKHKQGYECTVKTVMRRDHSFQE
jgi:hypothetical protein